MSSVPASESKHETDPVVDLDSLSDCSCSSGRTEEYYPADDQCGHGYTRFWLRGQVQATGVWPSFNRPLFSRSQYVISVGVGALIHEQQSPSWALCLDHMPAGTEGGNDVSPGVWFCMGVG